MTVRLSHLLYMYIHNNNIVIVAQVLSILQASSARGKSQTDMELELQSPLFPVHSFPADKLTSDPRFRVEAALRRAGLHATSYARRILAAIPPPQAPRPDQHSSLFKQD